MFFNTTSEIIFLFIFTVVFANSAFVHSVQNENEIYKFVDNSIRVRVPDYNSPLYGFENNAPNYNIYEDQYSNYFMTEKNSFSNVVPQQQHVSSRLPVLNIIISIPTAPSQPPPPPPPPPPPAPPTQEPRQSWDSYPYESALKGSFAENDLYYENSMTGLDYLRPVKRPCPTNLPRSFVPETTTLIIPAVESSESDEKMSKEGVKDVKDAFVENELDVDSGINAPEILLIVKYRGLTFKPGEQLEPGTPMPPPEVIWRGNLGDLYTLVMYDPDIPARSVPVLRSFLHWLVVNIPGNNVKEGEEVAPYLMPIALPKSELHRYTFLVFKQSHEIELQDVAMSASAEARVKFSVADFANRYKLGDPVYGNFFQYEVHDESDAIMKLKQVMSHYAVDKSAST